MKPIIAPSVLACDFKHLSQEIQRINESSAQWIHFDVMDGVFVPNISFGFPILQAVRALTPKFIDVHLMIVEPARYFEEFKKMGADHLSIHFEKNAEVMTDLKKIKSMGMTAGVVINPDTPASAVFHLLPYADVVLVMSVFPGFGGQSFIDTTFEKVKALKKEIQDNQYNTLIEVDGGVSVHNAKELLHCGADILVSGSALFKSADFETYVQSMMSHP